MADRINVCFTLSKNLLISPGPKDLFLRLSGPDNVILVKGKGDEFSFVNKEGDTLQYSSKKNITYENKPIDVCMHWDKTNDFQPGNYTASLYADGVLIGEQSLELK